MKVNSHFSDNEIKYFKNVLLQLRKQIVDDLNIMERDIKRTNPDEISNDNTADTVDLVDRAAETYEQELNFEFTSKEEHILGEIDAALKRIEDGTYGICEKYNAPITMERLKAVPYARYSIKAAEEEEKDNRRRGIKE